MFEKGARRVGNRRQNRNHPNYRIVLLRRVPGDIKRLTVTKNLVKNYQLKLVEKTRLE